MSESTKKTWAEKSACPHAMPPWSAIGQGARHTAARDFRLQRPNSDGGGRFRRRLLYEMAVRNQAPRQLTRPTRSSFTSSRQTRQLRRCQRCICDLGALYDWHARTANPRAETLNNSKRTSVKCTLIRIMSPCPSVHYPNN